MYHSCLFFATVWRMFALADYCTTKREHRNVFHKAEERRNGHVIATCPWCKNGSKKEYTSNPIPGFHLHVPCSIAPWPTLLYIRNQINNVYALPCSHTAISTSFYTSDTFALQIWEWDYQTEDSSVVLSVQNLSQIWPGVRFVCLSTNHNTVCEYGIQIFRIKSSFYWIKRCTNMYLHSQYNWLGTFQQLFEPSGVVIDPTQSVVVKNPGYFTNLTQLIMDTAEE